MTYIQTDQVTCVGLEMRERERERKRERERFQALVYDILEVPEIDARSLREPQ